MIYKIVTPNEGAGSSHALTQSAHLMRALPTYANEYRFGRDPRTDFQEAMAAAGLTVPDEIHADGRLHRFSTSGRRGDDSGWYVLHIDGTPAGTGGDWRTGISENWCAVAQHDLSPQERVEIQRRIREAQQMRDVEHCRRQGSSATRAQAIWESCEKAAEHRYLTTKGITAHGARLYGSRLVIPLRDTDGKIHSLQTVDPDGAKRFLPGGRVKGCYFAIGHPLGQLIVCEGFATGVSIHQATGQAVAVAFNAGNLVAVAKALHTKFPQIQISIAADDDWGTPGNPGRSQAASAALAVGGDVVLPQFPAIRPLHATDFNDLHALADLAAVRNCFNPISEA